MSNFVAGGVLFLMHEVKIDFPKVPCMPGCLIRFCGLVVELAMHMPLKFVLCMLVVVHNQ